MQTYTILSASGGTAPHEEWFRTGYKAQLDRRHDDAERAYRNALKTSPHHPDITCNLAVNYCQQDQLGEGALTIERALTFCPTHHVCWSNWAYMLIDQERCDEALAAAHKAVSLKPTGETLLCLATCLTANARCGEAVKVFDQILAGPSAKPNAFGRNVAFLRCFTGSMAPGDPAGALRARKQWYEWSRYTGEVKPYTNDRNPDRPLRVGYVSGDFKQHSASMIHAAVCLHHDPAQVVPYFYSTMPTDPAEDGITARYQQAAGERWRYQRWRYLGETKDASDAQADEQIRRDQIDILVDLSGHTAGHRLELFTRKPAPIQVTAWGFALGTGLPEMDYFFADPILVPKAERLLYVERIWDLPCAVTFEPPDHYQLNASSPPPQTRDERGWFTFGAFARYQKFSDECLAAWGEILRAVPNSRLLFADCGVRRPCSIRRIVQALKVPLERLTFHLGTDHNQYMQGYQQADLCLDPWPHSGGVMALEQLYMGVPVLTLCGDQPAGRIAATVLTAMGLDQWVTRSPEAYIREAVYIGTHPNCPAALRPTLRRELLDSPVCAGYREAVEAAYRAMWRRWCNAE